MQLKTLDFFKGNSSLYNDIYVKADAVLTDLPEATEYDRFVNLI